MLKLKIVDSLPMSDTEKNIVNAGHEAVKAQRQRLIEKGILDAQGNLLTTELPPDMKEDSRTEV